MMSGLELVEAARRQHPLAAGLNRDRLRRCQAIVARPADVSIAAKPFTVTDLTAAISSRVGIKPVADSRLAGSPSGRPPHAWLIVTTNRLSFVTTRGNHPRQPADGA